MPKDVLSRSPAAAPSSDRSLAPDLARGVMLLLIALSHAPAFVGDWNTGPAWLDATAKFVKSLVADNQARNMFVFLFGYGLVQLLAGQQARGTGWPAVKSLLRRRAWWLIVIGFCNAVVFVPIDIVAVYGLTLLVLAPIVRARASVLWWTGGLTLVPATLLLAWQSVVAQADPSTIAEIMEPTFAAHLLAGLPVWPANTVVSTVMVVPAMAMGILAARRRLLDEPERHLPLLRRLAAAGLTVALLGRLPAAAMAAGLWSADSAAVSWTVAVAHDLTGYAGGIGLAAAVGLVAAGLRGGRLTTALAALGRRSLTFYLFQALVWVVLFYPFTLGWHDDLGYAAALGIAVAVWVVSIVLADGMRAVGHRGLAEILLRRLTYRSSTANRGDAEVKPR
ncbi:DUF418 domain-containing protein [Nonomuraea gerenzanensis]|uniref:10 TMS hypothetical membrane protein n=1 Tax=Nonomuraea gerenzanensis TaxID=93944 RepID=A0A1M4E0M9_9ACTN|nr:DUF418 domain-containing protein [Nonomuraea gerenzanensis]UBU14655.1 DUF418 domain-containing protein [Nonomuraea gerenzanensis]SBO92373.1 10 TMS hypothetical membrane protein [Nonomuraea gerenzanensis]